MPGGGFVSTYTDITERKEAQEKIESQRDELEQSAPLAIAEEPSGDPLAGLSREVETESGDSAAEAFDDPASWDLFDSESKDATADSLDEVEPYADLPSSGAIEIGSALLIYGALYRGVGRGVHATPTGDGHSRIRSTSRSAYLAFHGLPGGHVACPGAGPFGAHSKSDEM